MRTMIKMGDRGEDFNHLMRRIITFVVALAVLAGGYTWFKKHHSAKKDQTTYEYGQVTRQDVKSIVTATGVLQTWKVVDIKSDVAGKIIKLAVDLGSRVKAGQLLMQIDPTDSITADDEARSDLQAANAKREQAIVSVQQERVQATAHIASAEKAVQSNLARLAEAQANMKVQPQLTRYAISQAAASLESARKSAAQAVQNKTELQAELATLRDVTIPLNQETVDSTVAESKANMDAAKNDYDRESQLFTQGYVAKSDVETAYAKLSSMQAAMRTNQQRQLTLHRENDLSVQQLLTKIDQAQSAIEEANGRVNQAVAALQLAQSNSVQNSIKQQEYEAAKAAVEQSKADLDAARGEYNQIAYKQGDVLSAQAQIVRSQAALKQAVVNLGYTNIIAPNNGIVITKNVEQGTVVPSSRGSIGSTSALLQIGDTSRMWVVCNVDETDIGQVSVGQKVTVKLDAYPSMLVDGKVIRIDPQAIVNQNVTLVPVTVEINEPDERFKPGMNATCEFIVDEADNVLTVPNEALKEADGVYTVQVMNHGKPKDIPVEVGIAGPDATEIRSGLKEGQQVITKTIQPEVAQAGTNNPFSGGGFGGGPRGGGGGFGGGGRAGGGGGRGGR